MKKVVKIMLVAVVMFIGTAAFAGPHGRRGKERDGLDIANGIVNLVLKVLRPQPAVIHQQPVYFHKPPVRHHKPVKKVFHKPAPPKPRRR